MKFNHQDKNSKQWTNFWLKQTLNEIISDLATDGASIRFITRNSFIRRAIKKEGFNLPVNERDVMKLLIEDFEQKIELHLDVKHRWNSIPTMISPLIKTKAALFETFAELNSLPIINELDFEALEILEKAMDPIRVTVLALSRQDATLMTADKALNFMISKLEQLNSDISKTLLDIFYNVEADEDVVAEAEVASSEEMSLECELDLILQKDTVNVSKIDNKFKWLKQEFTLFKNTGERTENFEKLYKAILCIRPTSTDVERVFSVSNNFCTKVRSRLSDKSLNALVFFLNSFITK
ncbi:hypothetical protein PVAND_012257 [Polypedilum vanderplanki]|uniref:HAT C-terminal dimerisation domain-containing protein n=1 Tax=Polypedilum vanderplanki TaxID=319348 RepID=A0A9J6CMT6_POLVA|nr:hypothetical protein PVAND_012257 [Polypedilum vanderplanki]